MNSGNSRPSCFASMILVLRSDWAGTTQNGKISKMEWKRWVSAEKRVSSNSIQFGHHALNPFDTEPMAKIAVKMSMRVVKFMSSPGDDFMSWQIKYMTNSSLEASSGDIPLSLHGFPWLPPGGC